MKRSTARAEAPTETNMTSLVNATYVRWYVNNHPRWGHLTDAALADELKLSAGFVGMVRSGSREPSAAFLKAIGWERVILYRMKGRHK